MKLKDFQEFQNNLEIKISPFISAVNNENIISNVDIDYIISKNNKKKNISIHYSKINLLKILKENANNLFFIKENYNLDLINKILLIINLDNPNKISNNLKNYFIDIIYLKDENIQFHENFFISDYLNQLFCLYLRDGSFIGYGLINKEKNNHFHFIKQQNHSIQYSLINKDHKKVEDENRTIFN